MKTAERVLMAKSDDVLVESVSTHHQRLRQAMLLGKVEQRRAIDDGVKSLIVSIVLAAVVCAGCTGFAFVRHALANQAGTTVAAMEEPR
jgi:alkylhydroperoxidase/carboxymuconolactone decarboxylase family protein YurZ